MPISQAQQRHWRASRRLTVVLLLVWVSVAFAAPYLARHLDFEFFGWPFSFWMGAQGAPLMFLLIVVVYAWGMSYLDRRYGVTESEAQSSAFDSVTWPESTYTAKE